MTELIFGEPLGEPDVLCREIPMDAAVIDKAAQKIEHWSADRGWDPEIITKVELIFEEKMMNLYDHGYDIRERSGEQALFYLRKKRAICGCDNLGLGNAGTQPSRGGRQSGRGNGA